MLNGAGVKLKNLDAMRNTMFVVSTSIGSEGTGTNHGEQLVIANDEVLFAKHIINYSKNISGMKEIAFNAFSFIQENYDSKKFSRVFSKRTDMHNIIRLLFRNPFFSCFVFLYLLIILACKVSGDYDSLSFGFNSVAGPICFYLVKRTKGQ
ncbi:hypothetical protein N1Z77_00008655 [Klebsiella pneumoniae]